MAAEKVLILDGRADDPSIPSPLLDTLTGVLAERGSQVRVLSGDDLRLTNCIGCFGCWLETPGVCRFKEAAGHGLLEAWVQSDTVILLTPVTFGGYSWRLKQAIDRTLPILLPHMAVFHGEVHHQPRYATSPRLIAIGLQDTPDRAEAETFQLLAGRHAIDCQAPSYAAEVLGTGEAADRQRETLRTLLAREDVFPRGTSIEGAAARRAAAGPAAAPVWTGAAQGRRACLIVGSPKTKSPSSSGVLGTYVLDDLRERGWETEALTLKATTFTPEGEADLFAAVDRADLLLFAFPLYVDALPSLLTRAVERIAAHRVGGADGGAAAGARRRLGLSVIVNNGFPESFQNNVALAICRNFSEAAGMKWLGGLALGAGESVIGGEPLKERSQLGFPLIKLHQALKGVADALDQGLPVPAEASGKMAAGPVPYTPFAVWRFLFLRGSKAYWEKRAAAFGVEKQGILARPFAGGAAVLPGPRPDRVVVDSAV